MDCFNDLLSGIYQHFPKIIHAAQWYSFHAGLINRAVENTAHTREYFRGWRLGDRFAAGLDGWDLTFGYVV